MNGIIYKQQLQNVSEILKEQGVWICWGIFIALLLLYELIQSYKVKRQLVKRSGALFPVTAATAIQLMFGSFNKISKLKVKVPEIYIGNENRFVKGSIYLKSDSAQEKSLWSVFIAIELFESVLESSTNVKEWKVREFVLYDLQRMFFRVAGAMVCILVLFTLAGSISWSLGIMAIKAFVPVVNTILSLQYVIITLKKAILYDRAFATYNCVLEVGIADENDMVLIEKAERRRISL